MSTQTSKLSDALAALPALAEEIGVDAAQREIRRELPFAAFDAFRRSGLGALRIPVERGGLGGTLENALHVVTTLAAAESNVAHALRVHFDVVESLRLAPRTAFHDRQVSRIVEGALFGGASGEQGTARAGEIETVLRREGDHFRVTGKKYYTTGTAYADFVRTNLVDEQGKGVTAIIPVRAEGVNVLDDWDGMGQRMTASGSTMFNDVRVDASEVVEKSYGSLIGRHGGAYRQLHLVAVAAGIVRNIVADARAYVTGHGRPVMHSTAPSAREDVFIQQVVGELTALSHTIDVLVRENARTLGVSSDAILRNDPGADELVLQGALATARTQIVVGKLALQAGERLFDAGGASATSRKHNFDRHWRNLRTIFSHNPLHHKAKVVGDYVLNDVKTHLIEGRTF
ncbi:acyl-CoA dehydrogenase (plasmid) [Burkholderia sp. SFA1]|uniref:acyl-CoA dehydrogenase family protein n=1 Tax=unclassified Caballeronia TaxID=2646786 RepID=UPI001F22E63C|nr:MULTISPECIES: acyl-CoA dehydrogenase family protein [unclassified Caballeronia]MCE4547019.1 acyl-CoA dehydrogenase family protein [Caballeronia sp. PC1]MCE4572508.1 acyl-CoA dehydrogenase family protein [Caballeronia sp. CLC5]BBQ02121.1 acyl-CoA dehydrogenase [Burkholderia sp. SFA1]